MEDYAKAGKISSLALKVQVVIYLAKVVCLLAALQTLNVAQALVTYAPILVFLSLLAHQDLLALEVQSVLPREFVLKNVLAEQQAALLALSVLPLAIVLPLHQEYPALPHVLALMEKPV